MALTPRTHTIGFTADCGHLVTALSEYFEVQRSNTVYRVCPECTDYRPATSRQYLLADVNYHIVDLGFELVEGDGYFYFSPFAGTSVQLIDSSVHVATLTELTRDEWRRDLLSKISHAIESGSHIIRVDDTVMMAHEYQLQYQGRVYPQPVGTKARVERVMGGYLFIRFADGFSTNVRVDFVRKFTQRKRTKRVRTK